MGPTGGVGVGRDCHEGAETAVPADGVAEFPTSAVDRRDRGVRQDWEPQDRIEFWTLLEEDQERLRNKSGARTKREPG